MENVLRMYLEGAVRVRYLVKSYGMGTLIRRTCVRCGGQIFHIQSGTLNFLLSATLFCVLLVLGGVGWNTHVHIWYLELETAVRCIQMYG